MRLKEIMSTGVVTTRPDESLAAARAEMRRHGIHHLVVIDGRRVAGIVSENDFAGVRSRGDLTVRDVMSTDVVSARPATTLRQAAKLMRGHTIGCLPVVENEQLVGLVTTTDLLDRLGGGAPASTARTDRPSAASREGGRLRAADREALPPALPRPVKLTRDRTRTVLPPAHVRVAGADLGDTDRDYISRKLGTKLGKFASSIERVTVRLSDANGPKGGRDQVSQIKVVISGLPSVVVEERDATLRKAVDRSINAMTVALRRTLQRRRTKPLRDHRVRPRTRPTA
jgi:acetoin utilization protein AcuB